MKEYQAIFVERIRRTDTVMSFRFVPASPIDFIPGQFLQILFDEASKNNPELNKYLSFSCAPGKSFVEVTKRMSQSIFSQRLMALKKGDAVAMKAPMGICHFSGEHERIGFLIGGIGITPVVSIVEYIVENKLSTSVRLLYSNRVEQDIAFKQELESWQKSYAGIEVFYTVTDCKPSDPACLLGVIDKKMVEGYIPDWKERVMYVFGSPGMVQALKHLCTEEMSCDILKIKTEQFSGY